MPAESGRLAREAGRERGRRAVAVQRVAGDGHPGRRQVHPDLVRPAGLRAAAQQRDGVRALGRLRQQLPSRHARPAVRSSDPAFGILRVARDGEIDATGPRLRAPEHHGEVLLLHLPALPGAGEHALRERRLGHQHHARCAAVEPVQKPRPPGRAVAGATEGGPPEQPVQQGAGAVPPGGVDDDPCGLVDREQVVVLVQHGERHLLGEKRRRVGRRRRELDGDAVAAQQPLRRLAARLPVHGDLARPHPSGRLDAAHREVGEVADECAVQPLAVVAAVGEEEARGRGRRHRGSLAARPAGPVTTARCASRPVAPAREAVAK